MPKLIPRMKYAFLGMSLEHGTKTVAYLNIFTYSVMALIFIMNSYLQHLSPPELEEPEESNNSTTPDPFENHHYHYYYSETWALGKNIKATFFLETTTILQLVFSAFLLYGANVRQSRILFSWVLLQTGVMFHSQLTVLVNFFVLFHGEAWRIGDVLSFIFQEIATMAFQFYCMLIVYYYYEQIENYESDRGTM